MRLMRFVVVALVGLGACSKAPAPAQGRTTIRFATDWVAEAEQGGFYEAYAEGEYARRGLDVTIIQGGSTVNVPELVASGAAEMGVGSDSFILVNLANAHAPVKAVAAFMQKDPQVLLAHPDAGIATIADMKGHPILLSDAGKTAFWPWLKSKYGLSDDQVRSYTFNNGPFILDKTSVQEGYVTSEPYTIARDGKFTPKVFLLADQGYPSYAGMVLAPDKLIAANPAAIRAFVEASAVGWRDYLHGNPQPAAALILKSNPDLTEDVLSQARDKMRQYGIIDGGDAPTLGVGAMTDQHWADFFRIVSPQSAGNAKSAYTLQFLPNPPVK